MTFYDHARWRLSVFTREEAAAIVAYLRTKRDADPHQIEMDQFDAALGLFWLERAASLARHLEEEVLCLAAIMPEAVGNHGDKA
jgi:hypothetical protein